MTLDTTNAYLNSLGSSGTSSTSSSSASTGSSSSIDMNGFLKLLTTQLQTQDPTDTQDTDQMVEQMATFSEVQGITEMNTSLSSISSDLSSARFDASGYLGRDALVTSDTVPALSSGGFAGAVTVTGNASDVTVNLVNSSGTTVATQDLGATNSGTLNWSWDGKDSSGNAVSGPLKIQVAATAASGSSVTTSNAAWSEVESVQSPANGSSAKIITSLGTYSPTDILQIG